VLDVSRSAFNTPDKPLQDLPADTTHIALAAISGAFYFLGGIAMVLAGICEFILGNSTLPLRVLL